MKEYNLNIIVAKHRCDPADFISISNKINKKCQNINVNIMTLFPADDLIEESLTEEEESYDKSLPSLTICLVDLPDLNVSGKLMMCRAIDKMDQYNVFKINNLKTPTTNLYNPNMDLSAFNDHVILKPFYAELQSSGHGLYVISKDALIKERKTFNTPYIIQQFIDSGNKPSIFRATMFLGEVLYICKINGVVEKLDGIIPENFHNKCRPPAIDVHEFEHYPDVYYFAKKITEAFPDSPILGVDIIKDHKTNELYVLEVNAGGNVWHFSSKSEANKNKLHPHHIYHKLNQYNAFNTAADALIRATKKYAE